MKLRQFENHLKPVGMQEKSHGDFNDRENKFHECEKYLHIWMVIFKMEEAVPNFYNLKILGECHA